MIIFDRVVPPHIKLQALMTSLEDDNYYLGIDVGTGSARAALVKADGTVLASASQETKTWRDATDHHIFEQSTTDVWKSICTTVREVIARSGVSPKHVKGIGFDATCSLAVTTWEGEAITVTRGSQLGDLGERNIVLWADHRAEKEADLINATGSSVLDYVGGAISVRFTSNSLGAVPPVKSRALIFLA
jgi:ribulose kinase